MFLNVLTGKLAWPEYGAMATDAVKLLKAGCMIHLLQCGIRKKLNAEFVCFGSQLRNKWSIHFQYQSLEYNNFSSFFDATILTMIECRLCRASLASLLKIGTGTAKVSCMPVSGYRP